MQQNHTGFTIVVPSYNQGRFIDETLDSLLSQNYPNVEILVIDGGSTDDTRERLTRRGETIQWVSEPDDGQSDAIAKGFARASKPWIAWLNSDDIQSNRALWAVDRVIAADPTVDVVVGQGHYMDADGGNPRPYPTIETGPGVDVRKELFEKGFLAQPSVYFRKDAYERIGGVDRSLDFCMDYDLWVRFALQDCRFAPCADDISGNRWYETTKTAGQLLDLLAEVAATQRRHFGKVSPYFVQAISDNLYAKFHSAHHGDTYHLLYRTLYFKATWTWLNLHAPLYCARGLLMESIAKSGPLAGDKATWADWWRGLRKFTRQRLNR